MGDGHWWLVSWQFVIVIADPCAGTLDVLLDSLAKAQREADDLRFKLTVASATSKTPAAAARPALSPQPAPPATAAAAAAVDQSTGAGADPAAIAALQAELRQEATDHLATLDELQTANATSVFFFGFFFWFFVLFSTL